MSDALTEVDFNIAEASKLPKGHFFKAAYELPNKQGTVRFTSKGRSMTAPTTLWVKGPKDKEYEEYKEYKNMRAAKKEYDGMKSAAQQEELDLFEDGEKGENKVTLKRKRKKGEIKVVPVERGERKAGEDEEDYEDRNPGGEKGWRSRKHLRHQKKDKEDQDKDPVGKQHEAAEWDVDDKKEKGEHADKTEAEIKKEIEKLKGKKGNEEEMASLKLALRAKGGWEKGEGATEEVEEGVFGNVAQAGKDAAGYADRFANAAGEKFMKAAQKQQDNAKKKLKKDIGKTTVGKIATAVRDSHRQAMKTGGGTVQPRSEEVEIDETLPDHLAKFLDKKGNPNKEAQARIDAGRKKRAAAAAEPKITDVTPKGYGPKEEVEVDEAKFKHPDAGVPLSVRRARKKKSAAQMKKDMNHADMLSKTNTGKAPVDYHRESEETIKEVSPPGWEGTIKAMKKDKDITNPWALGWWMKNKGYKSHKEEVEIDEVDTSTWRTPPGPLDVGAPKQSSADKKAGAQAIKRGKEVRAAAKKKKWDAHHAHVASVIAKEKAAKVAAATKQHDAQMQGAPDTSHLSGRDRALAAIKWRKEHPQKKEEVEIDELSTELLGRYKKRAAAQSSAASKAGYHKLAHKRYKGVNTATTLQFRNDAKKYDERQKKKKQDIGEIQIPPHLVPGKKSEPKKLDQKTKDNLLKVLTQKSKFLKKKNEEVDVDAFDYKAKKGAIAAPGSGSIAKPRKPKASDVNKSIEQQMADARKEEVTMEDMKWKVSLTGLPQFYMDGKSAAEVKLTLRKMLKRPDDILDIERTQLAKVRKDFRMRGQGKTEPENNSE